MRQSSLAVAAFSDIYARSSYRDGLTWRGKGGGLTDHCPRLAVVRYLRGRQSISDIGGGTQRWARTAAT